MQHWMACIDIACDMWKLLQDERKHCFWHFWHILGMFFPGNALKLLSMPEGVCYMVDARVLYTCMCCVMCASVCRYVCMYMCV